MIYKINKTITRTVALRAPHKNLMHSDLWRWSIRCESLLSTITHCVFYFWFFLQASLLFSRITQVWFDLWEPLNVSYSYIYPLTKGSQELIQYHSSGPTERMEFTNMNDVVGKSISLTWTVLICIKVWCSLIPQ